MQKHTDANVRMFRECAASKDILTRRQKTTTAFELAKMGECPLLLLAFDALNKAQAPAGSFEAVIGLLLEFGADPTIPDEVAGPLNP
jgi:hypothetical protein